MTTTPTNRKPINRLTCCCCGQVTRGRQWWNRDTGYGVCPKCADFIAERETPEEMASAYGERGVHYAIADAPGPTDAENAMLDASAKTTA